MIWSGLCGLVSCRMVMNPALDVDPVTSGMGGQQSGDDGKGIMPGGGGPLSGHLGQLYSQGSPYSRLPGGPPGREGGLPMGGGGNQDVGPPPPVGHPPTLANGSLKGTAPTIFDGNRKNTKQFTQEFTIY